MGKSIISMYKKNNCCRISIDKTYIKNCNLIQNNTNVCNNLQKCKKRWYQIPVTYICNSINNIKLDLTLNKCLIESYNCLTCFTAHKPTLDLWFLYVLLGLIILCIILRQKCNNHSSINRSQKVHTAFTRTITI